MLKENLVQLGLTNNEAKTYLQLIDVYKAKASEIAKSLNVTHPAAKKILDSLINKGIIKSQEYGKTTFYFPENSNKLIQLVDKQTKAFEKEQGQKMAIATEISALVDSKILIEKKSETKIKFYKGEEGIIKLTKQIANAENKTIYEFVDTGMLLYTKQKDTKKYIKEYENKGLKFEMIYIKKHGEFNAFLENVNALKLDGIDIDGPMAQLIIFDNKIIFSFITDDETAILIENQWIANTLLTLFKKIKKTA